MLLVKKSKYNKAKIEKSFKTATKQYMDISVNEAEQLDIIEPNSVNPVQVEANGFWYIGRDYLDNLTHSTKLPDVLNPTENIIINNTSPGWRAISNEFNTYVGGGLESAYNNSKIHVLFNITDSITIILPAGFDAIDQFGSSLIASNLVAEILTNDIKYNVYELYAMEFSPDKIIYNA